MEKAISRSLEVERMRNLVMDPCAVPAEPLLPFQWLPARGGVNSAFQGID